MNIDYALFETLVTGLLVTLAGLWVARRAWRSLRSVLPTRAAATTDGKACAACDNCGGCSGK